MHTVKFSIAPNYTLYGFRQKYTLQDDARITPFSVKITPFSASSPRSEDQESHDSPIWVKCRPLWVKSRPIVDPEYPPTGSAGMDTKMRQTIPGHLAREYRRAYSQRG